MANAPKPKPKVMAKKALKAASTMTPRETAARKIAKSSSRMRNLSETKAVKSASKMTPRETAARKIASESLARRQSENTTGMWSNDNPRGQKAPAKQPKYKDPTKIKGFAYGRKTQ